MNLEKGFRRIVLLLSFIAGISVSIFMGFIAYSEMESDRKYYLELNIIDKIIREIDDIDSSGQKSRYSRDTKGNLHVLNLPETLDLSKMKKTCDNLFSFFTACEDALMECSG